MQGDADDRLQDASTLTAHVLAVDDDPSVRKMIVDYLGDNDMRITALARGLEIRDTMARETIDLVVLDRRLPYALALTIIAQVFAARRSTRRRA